MARQPFSSSMSDMMDPYAAFRGGSSMSRLPTAYYFLRNILLAGALAGGLVAAYRNDVFLDLARRAGQEQRYLEFEKFFLGTPGWGTPRSMQPVLAGADDAKPAETSAAVMPVAPSDPAPTAAAPVASPEPRPLAAPAPAPQAPPAPSPVAQPSPPPVAAAPQPKPIDPLAPVSLDSLPLLGARSKPASAPVSVASLPAASPAPAPAARSFASSSGSKTRAIAVSLDDAPAAAPARAPRPKPEPAAAPEPAPAPVAAKPEPKGPKTTDPHPKDNPLTAAIRSAVRARPPKDTVPQ